MPAAHGTVHGLPFAAAREPGRRGRSDCVQDCGELGNDLAGAAVEELQCRSVPAWRPVVADGPWQLLARHRVRLGCGTVTASR